MGHAIIINAAEDGFVGDLPEADARAALRGEAPSEAPAITVKHWDCAQVHRQSRELKEKNSSQSVQISASMAIQNSLWSRSGARSVVK